MHNKYNKHIALLHFKMLLRISHSKRLCQTCTIVQRKMA